MESTSGVDRKAKGYPNFLINETVVLILARGYSQLSRYNFVLDKFNGTYIKLG